MIEMAEEGEPGSDLDEDPELVAAVNEWRLVIPKPNELFIDLDDENEWPHLHAMLGVLASNGVAFAEPMRTTTSPGGNTHVYLTLDRDVDPVTRIALQACCGSGRRRELLSLLRILLNLKREPTVFFETQEGT